MGKLNADKAQDALFFMLSREGWIEVANYKAKALPNDTDVPVFVEKYSRSFTVTCFAKLLAAPVVLSWNTRGT